jgi:hypothetical protein
MTYKETATAIGELANLTIAPTDYIGFFVNRHGEQIVFLQRPGQPHATLVHSDLQWAHKTITPAMMRSGGTGQTMAERAPGIGEIILNAEEHAWLGA